MKKRFASILLTACLVLLLLPAAALAVEENYDTFDYRAYANMYPDVKTAYGYNAEKLYAHYVNYGKATWSNDVVQFGARGIKEELNARIDGITSATGNLDAAIRAMSTDPTILYQVADLRNGTGASKFAPDEVCSRGQIVSFLYRVFAK